MVYPIRKRRHLLIALLVVPFPIIGVGVSLDGGVLPPHSETEEPLKETALKSSRSQDNTNGPSPTQSSEIARQLSRAIEAANQNETEETWRLEAAITSSQTAINETNHLLEEKGLSIKSRSNSENSLRFHQQLGELQSRLAELKALE
jgi:post-segregation antitoxin (ccd killing protein)